MFFVTAKFSERKLLDVWLTFLFFPSQDLIHEFSLMIQSYSLFGR